jgi:membrane-associated protein
METINQLMQYMLHIDTYLFSFVANYGGWTYLALFAIIFCETALVITPFLPGDSLLFAAGSIASQPEKVLSIQLLFLLLLIASILGNKINYFIGKTVGPTIFSAKSSFLLNKNHLTKTRAFYEKHGGKTIILARFIPVIRSFAPFVAGASGMDLRQFTTYNIISAFLWIGSMLGAGYLLGSLPFISAHFSLVIYSIIAISISPPIIAFLYRKIRNLR